MNRRRGTDAARAAAERAALSGEADVLEATELEEDDEV
jgi:hypothetical protein